MKSWLQIAALLVVSWRATAADDECDVTTWSYAMRCGDRGLTSVPAGTWPEIWLLYLRNNAISKLYSRSFTGFPNVTYLTLEYNQLSVLELAVFATMPRLQTLEVNNNQIHAIEAVPAAISLDGLKYLYVNHNNIASLDPDVLQGAPNLESFLLNNNPYIITGTGPIFNHPNLQLLDLQYSQAQRLSPINLASLPKLERIWLTDSGITNVTGMFVRTPLLHIHLARNYGLKEVLAGSFYPEEVLENLYFGYSSLQKLEVSAVNGAVKIGGVVNIGNTPLACSCGYEGLYWWAFLKGVDLQADCGATVCHFARRQEATAVHT